MVKQIPEKTSDFGMSCVPGSGPPGEPLSARASSSLLDDPAEDPPVEETSPASPVAGKQLQREASASILCRQASELRRDSSQVGPRGSMVDPW